MRNFVDAMLEDDSTILVSRPVMDLVFTFSNSGRGGGVRNWFAMTGSQLAACLQDLLVAGDDLPERYDEKQWRKIFADYLTDDIARTMGAVQTLPLFEIIAKIIHYSNGTGPRTYKMINLDREAVRNAIVTLESYNPERF